MTSAEEKCTQLWGLLKEKAPVLKPKIIARGFDDDQLLALCSSEEQKLALDSYLDTFSNSSYGSKCSICSDSITEAGGTFASEWEFEFESKTQKFNKLHYLCETCYTLTDLEEFLPLASAPNADILHFIAKFHSVNGLSNEEYSPVMLVDYLQQCYSIAYSLKVLLSNFPHLKLVDHLGHPFSSSTDFKKMAKYGLAHIKSNKKNQEETADSTTVQNNEKSQSTKSKSHGKESIPKSLLFDYDKEPRRSSGSKSRESIETNESAILPPKKMKKVK